MLFLFELVTAWQQHFSGFGASCEFMMVLCKSSLAVADESVTEMANFEFKICA